MDAVVKTLVAAACVCVIAVCAHYGYARYQEHIAEVQHLETMRVEGLATIQRAKEQLERIAAEEGARKEEERAAKKEERAKKRKAFLERIEARRAARTEEEHKKQADRDNAAAILKDAVTNY